MSTLVNSEKESQTISTFKLEAGYESVELQVEWTIKKSTTEKVAHHHDHKIDEDDDDDDNDESDLTRISAVRTSIVDGKYTNNEINEFLEHIK